MRYLYQRGASKRRVMHLCGFDPKTGEPTMTAACGINLPFDTTINLPLGKRTCRRCIKEANRG